MIFFKKNKINGGFMTVEVIVAASIIVISIIAAMSVTQKAIQVSRQSFHTSQASFLLEEGAEAVKINRDNAWANISGLTAGVDYYTTCSGGGCTLNTTPSQIDNFFTRIITVSQVYRDGASGDIVASGGSLDADTKLVTVTVFWPEGSNTVSKVLKFYIINIFS